MFLLWSFPIAFAYYYFCLLMDSRFELIAEYINTEAGKRNIQFNFRVCEGRFDERRAKVGAVGFVCGFLFSMLFLVTENMEFAHSPVSPLFMCMFTGAIGAFLSRYGVYKAADKAEGVVSVITFPVILIAGYGSMWLAGKVYYGMFY